MPTPERGPGDAKPPAGPSLSTALLLRIAPVTLGAVLLTAAAAYQAARQVIIRDAHRALRSRAETAALRARAFFDQREDDLEAIVQSPLFPDYYRNREYGLLEEAEVFRRQIELLLEGYALRSGAYAQLRFLDEGGREAARVRADAIERPGGPPEPALLSALRGLPPAGRRFERPGPFDWHPASIARYAAPVRDGAGRLRGAVVLDCSLGPVLRMLEDPLGRTPVRSRLLDSRFPEAAAGPGELSAAAVVKGTPWAVLAVVARRDLLQGLELIATATALLSLLACFVMSAIVISFVRAANRPILRLAEAARALAAGRLDARVAEEGPREVGALAAAFNAMAESLRQRTAETVQRLRELSALRRMSDAVLSQLGGQEIGRTCLEAAVTGLQFERGALYWVDAERGELAGGCVFGIETLEFCDASIRGRRVPLDSRELLAAAARSGESATVDDARADPRCREGEPPLPGSRAFCLAPIRGRDRVLGIIVVDRPSSPEPIPALMARSLALYCGAAGLALENAKLLRDIIASEERFRAAVENAPDAIIALDEELRLTLCNPRAEALFGWRARQALDETLGKALNSEDYAPMRALAVEGRPPAHAEARGKGKDGRDLELVVSWTALGRRDGPARGWFVVVRDETERKRLEGHLKDAEKAATAGHLVASVTHEMNNPMMVVMTTAQILSETALPAGAAADIRTILSHATHCHDVIRGLLAFARRSREDYRRHSLNAIVEQALTLFEHRCIKSDDIGLEVELAADPLEISGDFVRLQQLVVNLLRNAYEELTRRVGLKALRVRSRREGGRCVLEVEDSGGGVAPKDRERIFEALVTTKGPGQGTGLGLWICRLVALDHGGDIRCDEGPEKGARFIVSLPACPKSVKPPEVPPTALPPPVPGRRVLVVEDDPQVLRLMLRMLEDDGLVADAADGLPSAESRLARSRYDLLVTDVALGGRKGTELLRPAAGSAVPPRVLLVTGDILNRPLMEELRQLGAPMLHKPFTRADFLRAVRRELAEAAKRPRLT